jgi:hypothetical protein
MFTKVLEHQAFSRELLQKITVTHPLYSTLIPNAQHARSRAVGRSYAHIRPQEISAQPRLDSACRTMAVNRIKGAFAVPRKGETFELRAGLVYEYPNETQQWKKC